MLLEAVLLCICLCGNLYHLSVFGNIIAIDVDYSTDFKFHPTRGCCFNSYNDVPQVAQRNVSIVANTRHRSPYLPQPDCCCFVSFLITTPPPASQRNVSMAAERGVVHPSIAQPDCCCCVLILKTMFPRWLSGTYP